LRVTHIGESDDNLQAAASAAKRNTPVVVPEAEINDDDDLDDDLDDELDNDLRGLGDEGSPIDNDIGYLRAQRTDEDHLDVVTQSRLMREMLLKNQVKWKAEQRLERVRMPAKQDRMAAVWDWLGTKRTKRIKRSIACSRPNICNMFDAVLYCGGRNELG